MGAHLALDRRRFLHLSAAAAATTALAGCGVRLGGPSRNDVIAAITGEPKTLDPFIVAGDVASSQVMGNVYEALLDYDFAEGRVVGVLAEKWEQRGPTTWAFKLREGVKFHKDYGELTAEDVVYNIEKTLKEKKPRQINWQPATGARAVGKYELEVSLQRVDQPFLIAATTPSFGFIASKRAIEEMGFERFQRNPVGTGPFAFESWVAGSEIVLRRFAGYWRSGQPKLERLTFRPVADAFVKLAQFERGELDFIDRVDYKDVARIKQNTGLSVVSTPSWVWDYLTFGLKDATKPWAKKEVRQAIAYAIDRDAIANETTLYAGHAAPTDDPVPPGFMGYKEGPWVYGNKADVAKARSLMQQAGYGSGFTATMITSDFPHLRREAELVANQLKDIGITVQIQGLDLAAYNAKVAPADSKFDLALEDIVVTAPDTDRAIYNFFHPKGSLNHGYNDPDLGKLLDDARLEADQARRADMYRKITQKAVEDASYVFTVHPNLVRGANAKLKGIPAAPQEGKIFMRTVEWS